LQFHGESLIVPGARYRGLNARTKEARSSIPAQDGWHCFGLSVVPSLTSERRHHQKILRDHTIAVLLQRHAAPLRNTLILLILASRLTVQNLARAARTGYC